VSDEYGPLTELGPAERHRGVAGGFATIVDRITDWDAPSPVEPWSASDVVAHLVDWSTGFLAGGEVDLPAADQGASDPADRWRSHQHAIQALLDDAATAATTFGHPMVGTHRLDVAIDMFYTADVFMHTWDLAEAAGADHQLDTAFAEHLLEGMRPIENALRSSGHYGPAVPVSDDADPVTKLMAFVGRDPAWRLGARPSTSTGDD
jgi:uncharacterized protein (TIGR03086 family)